MATTDSTSGTKTYEQVLAEVSAADAQTFFQAAQRFEQAARMLGDTEDKLSKYRRDLAQAWQSNSGQGSNRIDKLIKDIDSVVAAVKGGYASSLRQIGDAITESQQRLRALKAEADAKAKDAKDDKEAAAARADLDKRATKIEEELSASYRTLGGQLTALPGRTATGGALNLSAPGGGASGGGASGGGASGGGASGAGAGAPGTARSGGSGGGNTGMGGMAAFAMTRTGGPAAGFSQQGPGSMQTTQTMQTTGSGIGGTPGQLTMTGSAGSSGAAAQFSRFSQFASAPGGAGGGGGAVGGKGSQAPSSSRQANSFESQSSKDAAKTAVLGKASAPASNGATKDDKKDSKQSMSMFSMPSMLESQPASSSSGDLSTLLTTAAGLAGPAMGSVTLPAQATAAAGGPQNGITNLSPTPAPQPAPAGSTPGQGPGQGPGPGPNPGPGLNLSQSGPAPADAAHATSGLASAARPAAPVQLPGVQQVVSPTAAGTTSALSQLRPGMGLEHLQMSGLSPNGAPVVPGMTSGTLASAPLSPSSMMHAASPSVAAPNGVLGGRARRDNVWLRADPGCWTLTPIETGRLGRNRSTIDIERGAEPRVTTNPERKADERLDSPVQVLGRGQRGRSRLARSRTAEAVRHHEDAVGSGHDGEGQGSVAYGGLRRAG